VKAVAAMIGSTRLGPAGRGSLTDRDPACTVGDLTFNPWEIETIDDVT
jgi:hypothetical protein